MRCFFAFVFIGLLPNFGKADEAAVGFRLYVGVGESSHIGAYDTYIAPIVQDAIDDFFDRDAPAPVPVDGGGGPVVDEPDSFVDILLPDGLPDDFTWHYRFKPSVRVGIDAALNFLELPNGGAPVVSLFWMRDETTVTFNAPSGFGILIDPTRAMAHSEFEAFAVSLALPFFHDTTESATTEWRIGGGAMHTRVHSFLDIRSDFIQLRETVRRTRNHPLGFVEWERRWNTAATSPFLPDQIGVQSRLTVVQTDEFYEVAIGLGLVLGF
ncbi:MAG: hypothetical protein AAGB15_08135 [Pseudomonadota bacterium]